MRWGIRLLVIGIALFASASTAQAAMPGMNGKIAFVRNQPDGTGEIYTMNANGSGETRLTNDASYDIDPAWSPDGSKLTYSCLNYSDLCLKAADGTDLGNYWGTPRQLFGPSWAPDGSRVAFANEELYCDLSGDCTYINDIERVSLDGMGFLNLTGPNSLWESEPSWSPRGDKIAYDRSANGLYTVRPDGTGVTPLGVCCHRPDWSPDGTRIAYDRRNIYVANADGSGEVQLTTSAAWPSWSPDGHKIAFSASDGNDSEIFVMNADGSGRTAVTHNTAPDYAPNWQPLPYPGYARPKGATPVFVSLVPAYAHCPTPNREHGPPLSFGSCAPPQRASSQLTVGTPDANGQPAKSIGSVSLYVVAGDPATPSDEADVVIATDVTDMRRAADLADYTGTLDTRIGLRLTDRSGADPQTLTNTSLSVPVPCVATSDTTIGARCTTTTTADAVVPGVVPERARSIWALDQISVLDGTGTPFAVQGVFVP